MTVAFLNPLLIRDSVSRALEEDLGRAGDITTTATIPASAGARAVIASRQHGVIAGLPLAEAAFHTISPGLRFTALMGDGTAVKPGDVIAEVEGSARALLSAERVALNFLGRLSGVASLTRQFVDQVAGTECRIVCTRKTTPGMRAFEKYAVRCGGGFNHRYGLDDAVLIKDNHIAVAGGVVPALRAAKSVIGHLVKIEIEVDTLDQLREVLSEGADVVLLDNMDLATLSEAVALVEGAMLTEASGGVTLETVAGIAATGVDMISVGALTHSPRVLDLGLDIRVH
jgi:nicotinate-nucleotide pyrophosphorylase (carboxylating)